jgi:hypothetical protein
MAIHQPIASLACSLTADQTLAAFVVAITAMVDIDARIDGRARAIGHTCTCHTGVILANLAIGTFIRAATASVDGAHGHFGTTAICRAISELALSLVTNQAVIAAVAAISAMIQLDQSIAQNTITYRIAKTTPTDALLTAGTFKAVFTAVQVVIGFTPVFAQFILCQMVVALARIGNAFAIDAVAAIPPCIRSAVFGFDTTGGLAIGFASIFINMMVIHTGGQLARTATAYHGLAIFW